MNQLSNVICLCHFGILFTTLRFPLLPKLTMWIQPKIGQRKVRSSRTRHGDTSVVLKASPRAHASLLMLEPSCSLATLLLPWGRALPLWNPSYGLGCWSLYPNKPRIRGDQITQTLPLKTWKYLSASESALKVIQENECINESGCQPSWQELTGVLTELLVLAFCFENNRIIQHGVLYIQHW